MAGRTTVHGTEIEGEGAFDLTCLASWINRSLGHERSIPRIVLLNQNGDVLRLAERCSILRHHGVATQVTCLQCDDAHAAKVIAVPDGKFGYDCLLNGWVELAEDEVTLLRFDRAALLNTLVVSAGLKSARMRFFAGGRLVCFGLVSRAADRRGWMLGYADHLEDCNTLSDVTTALDNQFPRGPGLIITPSLINLNLPLPGGYRLIGLADIAYGTSDGLAVNWETTDVYLRKRKKVAAQRGRPSERKAIWDIWKIARQSSQWPQHQVDQANFILTQWNRAEAPPSAGTIKNYLPTFEREVK